MTDVQTAKNNLAGHTICLCKGGQCLYSDERGISPMMRFIADGVSLAGYSVADTVVGKAAALLFVKCGIRAVFAKTLSHGGREILEQYGIAYTYETQTDRIVNRAGTDMCPMEKAVLNVSDADEGYTALLRTLQAMQK